MPPGQRKRYGQSGPAEVVWPTLFRQSGDDLHGHYRQHCAGNERALPVATVVLDASCAFHQTCRQPPVEPAWQVRPQPFRAAIAQAKKALQIKDFVVDLGMEPGLKLAEPDDIAHGRRFGGQC